MCANHDQQDHKCCGGCGGDEVTELRNALMAAHLLLVHALNKLGGSMTLTRESASEAVTNLRTMAVHEEANPVTGDYVVSLVAVQPEVEQ